MDTSDLRAALAGLARNHVWTWHDEIASIFASLPTATAERPLHPAAIVSALDDQALASVAGDDELITAVEAATATVATLEPNPAQTPDVAYFSPEFGISDLVPQYSGGLGILAGDHLKAASDLDVSLAGVGLFYRGGFFRQDIAGGRQVERYEVHTPDGLGCVDTGQVVAIPFPGRTVSAKVWKTTVGRIPLVLLDTDLAANTAADRAITDRLYSGDRRHRIEQEMVLGAGGARALAALGWQVPVHHLNEGHAGFLIFELIDRHIATGATLTQALAAIRPGLVFTTHTPVPAGIDRFEPELASEYIEVWAERWKVDADQVMALGTDEGDDPPAFNMAALCLKASGRANGVSKLHGQVSRELFAGVPGGDAIGSVTNGVHARTWVAPRLAATFDDVLGDRWTDGDPGAWARVAQLDDDTVRSLRRAGGHDLRSMVAARTGADLDPDALIVGFARRFATYKRATLLLQQPDALAALLGDDDRPIQFVFAGKAHPADTEGKAVLADIVAHGTDAASKGRFLFVPDYDIAVARAMYAGCDVWLNNPIRPHEASGTSGEKSALNGGLNHSISDGWWDEMADGRNGWIIPNSTATTAARRDLDEARDTLAILAGEIVPEYYADGGPWSAAWIARIRDMWTSLGPKVTAARMVADYRDTLYLPALADATAS